MAEQDHKLMPIDTARYAMVLRDVVGLRDFATKTAKISFRGNLHNFLLPDDVALRSEADVRDSSFRETVQEVSDSIGAKTELGFKDAQALYGQASARAALTALSQRLRLEEEFAAIA